MKFLNGLVKTAAAHRLPLVLCAALVIVSGLALWMGGRTPTDTTSSGVAEIASASAPAPVSQAGFARPASAQNSHPARPFAAVRASDTCEWTAEDGRDPNVIQRLAHNDLEYQRMVEENSRILRRQLVYRNDTVAAVMEHARLTGTTVRRLTLPGLDGQEVEFEITQADLNPSGQQGMLGGRIVGQPDSMVTLAFKGGREAFTVIAPSQNLFLQADPREPGQVIVKSIDPATYVVGVCGTP